VTLAGEEYAWEDLFSRASDRLVLACSRLKTNAGEWRDASVELWAEKLVVRPAGGQVREFRIEDVTLLEGTASEVVIPREAMGFGDVLFLMMIGAFLGWQAVILTVFAASVLGTLVSGATRLLGLAAWGSKLPFGPYLAGGALVWLFRGPELLAWYLGKLRPPGFDV
jgi:leader peptidase (prepilin peptidase)/N-methyltransferase